MKNKKRTPKTRVRPLITLTLLVLITAGAVFGLALLLNQSSESSDSIDPNINYGPPTDEEIAAGQNIKDTNEEKNGQATIADYSVFITDASQYGQNIEVRSYVEGIVKDGGTCTFAFTKNATTITKTSEGLSNVSRTSCALLNTSVSEFPTSGTWSLSVSYTFENITASSTNYNVEISK